MNNLKNILFIIITSTVLVLTILFPNVTFNAAYNGLILFATVIVPTLFPFFVGISLLQKSGLVRIIAAFLSPVGKLLFGVSGYSVYIFLSALIAGSPSGARITAELYRDNLIGKSEAEHVSCFTVIAGPMFIFGTVAITLLKSPELGAPLFFVHILGAILCGIILRIFIKHERKPVSYLSELKTACSEMKKDFNVLNIASSIDYCIVSSIKTMLLIGGIVVVFSVLTESLNNIGVVNILSKGLLPVCRFLGVSTKIAPAIIIGAFEMTIGCVNLAGMNVDMYSKIVGMTIILSFSGLSVFSQVKSILQSSHISSKKIVFTKILQAIISVVLINFYLVI